MLIKKFQAFDFLQLLLHLQRLQNFLALTKFYGDEKKIRIKNFSGLSLL